MEAVNMGEGEKRKKKKKDTVPIEKKGGEGLQFVLFTKEKI